MLFIVIIIGYSIFLIIRSLNRTSPVGAEHFIQENPDYQYRMEVMKVFDLYLNRNPTNDEIEKYSKLKNEQEILLAFLRDFNISASDLNKEKLAQYAEKEVKKMMEAATPAAMEASTTTTAVFEETPTDHQDNNIESFDDDEIKIPIKTYLAMKKSFEEFHENVAKHNQALLEHYL